MEYEALHAQHLLEFVYMSSISTGSSITNDGEVLDTQSPSALLSFK
jgi:hypothetical protein